MLKSLGFFLAIALASFLLPAQLHAQAANRIIESDRVTANGVEFSAITFKDWVVSEPLSEYTDPKRKGTKRLKISSETVDIQLRIANRTKKDLVFPLKGTFRLFLKGADGLEMRGVLVENKEIKTQPIVLAAGTDCCLSKLATIHWNKEPGIGDLLLSYGFGSESSRIFGGLVDGPYSLSFEFISKMEPEGQKELHGVEVWHGSATTPPLKFKIHLPPTANDLK